MGKGLTVVRSLQRKHMLDSRVREHVQTSLQGIAEKARGDRKYRFCDVYRLINEEMLLVAWNEINKNAASGVDRVTARENGENLIENIRDLVLRLKENRYKAKLVRRVYIYLINRNKILNKQQQVHCWMQLMHGQLKW